MAEKCFWNAVKTDRFMGLHFRRQQIIHGFIADFYCEELNLVVEIDGGIHEEQRDYDKLRPLPHSLSTVEREADRRGEVNEEVVNRSERVLSRIKELAYPVDKRL